MVRFIFNWYLTLFFPGLWSTVSIYGVIIVSANRLHFLKSVWKKLTCSSIVIWIQYNPHELIIYIYLKESFMIAIMILWTSFSIFVSKLDIFMNQWMLTVNESVPSILTQWGLTIFINTYLIFGTIYQRCSRPHKKPKILVMQFSPNNRVFD